MRNAEPLPYVPRLVEIVHRKIRRYCGKGFIAVHSSGGDALPRADRCRLTRHHVPLKSESTRIRLSSTPSTPNPPRPPWGTSVNPESENQLSASDRASDGRRASAITTHSGSSMEQILYQTGWSSDRGPGPPQPVGGVVDGVVVVGQVDAG